MKQFIGWILAGCGTLATGWGGYCLMSGTSQARVYLTDDLSITGLTGGLIGVAMLTVGLLWTRD